MRGGAKVHFVSGQFDNAHANSAEFSNARVTEFYSFAFGQSLAFYLRYMH